MKILSEEKKEELRQERIEYTKNLTLEYQLGIYVGEHIIYRYLPTLSTDIPQTRKVITVNDEDTKTYNELNNTLTNNENDENWKAYRNFADHLTVKYLPDILECHISPLNIFNIDEFKIGLGHCLWDCDCCSYGTKPEEIEIINPDHGYFTIIKLKLRT